MAGVHPASAAGFASVAGCEGPRRPGTSPSGLRVSRPASRRVASSTSMASARVGPSSGGQRRRGTS
eukprot:6561431-Prymnesium_polylepis.1